MIESIAGAAVVTAATPLNSVFAVIRKIKNLLRGTFIIQ